MKKNVLTVWAKRALPALALAGVAGLTLPSCEKEPEKHDVNVPFYYDNTNNKELEDASLRKYAADKSVRNIYITVVPGEDFTNLASDNISRLRLFVKNKMDISSKNQGRGNFAFAPGVCTYGDSIDIVKMGFTINQQNQR